MGIASTFRQDATLARVPQIFEKRFDAYAGLLTLTHFGDADRSEEPKPGEREDLCGQAIRMVLR
jgi:hypothetical protein